MGCAKVGKKKINPFSQTSLDVLLSGAGLIRQLQLAN